MTRESLKQTMLLAMSEHHSGNAEEAGRIVDAQLVALEAAGVRLVPVEATEEMQVAGTEDWLCERAMEDRALACWKAMLSASPYKAKDAP